MGWLAKLLGLETIGSSPASRSPKRRVGPAPSTTGPLRTVSPGRFNREVAGESFRQDVLARLCGDQAAGPEGLFFDAELVPDPTNAHDPNAVRVEISGELVGHLPRADAAKYVAALAKAGLAGRRVRVQAKVLGGARLNQHARQNYGVFLDFNWPLRLEGR